MMIRRGERGSESGWFGSGAGERFFAYMQVDKFVRKMRKDDESANDGCDCIVGKGVDEKGDGRKDIQDRQLAKPGFVLLFHLKAPC